MSDPQRAMPLIPADSAWVTADESPSKPHTVVGSPPHTLTAQRAAPVQPERWKRITGLGSARAIRATAQW